MKYIYLDHAATTPVDPKVLEVMLPYFSKTFGNPSSIHTEGQKARSALWGARRDVAKLIGANPREVVFVGGGTESINLAIKGVAEKYAVKGKHIITSKIEHSAVLKCAKQLEHRGFEVTYLGVNQNGSVDPKEVEANMRKDTILVSIMYANNEIGTIQEIAKIAKIAKAGGALMHTDACQASGALDIKVTNLGVDLMSLNGSKMYGPKGIGVLYKREGVDIAAQIHGGGQELGLRAGTENLPLAIGFAKALEIAEARREKEAKREMGLRDFFIKKILTEIPDTKLNGHPSKRLPNNIHITFKGIEGETILIRLDMEGIAVSAASACASGSVEPSHVISALGVPQERAHSSIRFSLGRSTTKKNLLKTISTLKAIVKDLREFSPLF